MLIYGCIFPQYVVGLPVGVPFEHHQGWAPRRAAASEAGPRQAGLRTTMNSKLGSE